MIFLGVDVALLGVLSASCSYFAFRGGENGWGLLLGLSGGCCLVLALIALAHG